MTTLERVGQITVTPQDMLSLIPVLEAHSKDQGVDGGEFVLLAIADRYRSQPAKAEAIAFRFRALVVLLRSSHLPGWTVPLPDGILAGDTLLAAAATHPFKVPGDDAVFDRESFLAHALSLVEPKGHA